MASNLDTMTTKELIAYLQEKEIDHNPSAPRTELLALAKGNNDKVDTPKQVPPAKEPPQDTSPEGLLRTLQAKGFRDFKELREYLGVIDRDLKILVMKMQEMNAFQEDLVRQDIKMTEREKALVKKVEELREDIAKQAELYEKNAKIKSELIHAGAAGAAL